MKVMFLLRTRYHEFSMRQPKKKLEKSKKSSKKLTSRKLAVYKQRLMLLLRPSPMVPTEM